MLTGIGPAADVLAALERRRRALARELAALTAPPPPGSGIGFGKRVGEGTAEAVERLSTTAAARSLAASLAAVDRALAQVADGSYGRCDRCRVEIAHARLAARPASTLCVACAREVGRDARPLSS